MCTNGIEYYCRHDVYKANGVGKEKKKKKKINRVNTMTTIETISWSKNTHYFTLEVVVNFQVKD